MVKAARSGKLHGTFPGEDGSDGFKEDDRIQNDAPVFYVVKVEHQLLNGIVDGIAVPVVDRAHPVMPGETM